ncbi:MAG: hypothetical protein US89_C0021G0003 [Candidatus Peregrinibacteria bacterium GW2011_GWF2_38_29]|nr:MAG: hypothetical protein US89_C0021G0003 [Candidatus Peregrinibacteria bacterium GW2011_GWF2_38_29]
MRNKLLRINLRKVVRYQGNKYTLGDLLSLWKEQGSLVKIAEITHIFSQPKLYKIFRKHFGNRISGIKKQVRFIKRKSQVKAAYNLKKIVRLFKKYGFLPDVSKAIGIPTISLRNILTKEFGMGLNELRRKLKGRKAYFRNSDKSSFRCQQVKAAYERLGTLEKAGKELGLTKQRVSQILLKGKRIGLFSYERKGRNLKTLKRELTREVLINDIESLFSEIKICAKYSINKKKFRSLLRHFSIDFKEYQRATRAGRHMKCYSKIVDDLGYHPSTTELNSRSDWRKVWHGIRRYWENFENFRKEFGIEKPKRKMSEKLLERNIKAKSRRSQILDLLKESSGHIPYKEISLKLGVSLNQIYNDIARFRKEGMLTDFDIRTRDYNEIDEKKFKIFSLIKENNAISIEEISKQLGLGCGVVYGYIRNLRKEGKLSDATTYYKKSLRIRGSGEERKLAVLNLIKENDTITAVEIAAKLGVHRSRVYEAVNYLCREGRLIESYKAPWKRRTPDERKNTLLNFIRKSDTLDIQRISKETGIPVVSIYRYIRQLRKERKI